MEPENYCKMEAGGPCREKALDAIRSRAKSLRERGKQMIYEADQYLALVSQLEEMEKYAASQRADGADGPVPYIGVGSDAEEGLWRLAIQIGTPDWVR